MIKEALEWIASRGGYQVLHEGARETIVAHRSDGKGANAIIRIEPSRVRQKHILASVGALIEYIGKIGELLKDKKDKIIVGFCPRMRQEAYANPDLTAYIKVDLDYGEQESYRDERDLDRFVKAQLTPHRSFLAMLRLGTNGGMTQKVLWSLLSGDLAGRFDSDLVAQVARLRVISSRDEESIVSAIGIEYQKGEAMIKVEAGRGENAQRLSLRESVTYKGPVWNEWPETVEVPMRIEFGEGKFLMRPIGLDDILGDFSQRMLDQLNESLAGTAIFFLGWHE